MHRFLVFVSIFGILSAPALGQVRLTRSFQTIFSTQGRTLALEEKLSLSAVEDTADGKESTLVILLADQADLGAAYDITDQDARGWYVYRTLSEHAASSQRSLRALLTERGVEYQSFWVANMVIAELDRDLAVEVAGRSDVARVDSNRATRWIAPPEVANDGVTAERPNGPDAIEWGVANVKAPDVWAQGFTGNGIVVGGLDTGIRWTHNAIKSKYRGWNGTTADHNYNWHDAVHAGGGSCGANTTAPCDDNNHGSHTVGTMVGDDGAGNQIGVAPGAKWIGCRNMNVGDGTPATYSECLQFMIAPTNSAGANPNPSLRPHIINNSWGCTPSEGCTTRAELEVIVNNTQASGIFVQTSAGNAGSGCSTVSQPPGLYDASFAAGAIDINNGIVGFSSRGPSTFYSPNLLKPNIVGPGSNVRSIVRATDASYQAMSGTSMASPHVAGVVALIWSARPNLVRNIAATKALLESTANPGVTAPAQTCGGISSTQIPNNTFGHGRVDALAAINASALSGVVVGGRVLTPEGQGLRNVVVSLTDQSGARETATTSSFGVYSFPTVPANATYTMTVSSKRYRFAPKTVNLQNGSFTAPDFVGLQ